ncbi:MAG: hypothetical protein ACRED0_00395, partial [Gammaproteobacteria bacterium]
PVLCLRSGRAFGAQVPTSQIQESFKGLVAEAGYRKKWLIWIIGKRETGLGKRREVWDLRIDGCISLDGAKAVKRFGMMMD